MLDYLYKKLKPVSSLYSAVCAYSRNARRSRDSDDVYGVDVTPSADDVTM